MSANLKKLKVTSNERMYAVRLRQAAVAELERHIGAKVNPEKVDPHTIAMHMDRHTRAQLQQNYQENLQALKAAQAAEAHAAAIAQTVTEQKQRTRRPRQRMQWRLADTSII